MSSDAVFNKFREWGGIEKMLPEIRCRYDATIPNQREELIKAMREQAELDIFLDALQMARDEAWEGYRRNAPQNLMAGEEKYFDHIHAAVHYYIKMDARAEPILVVNPMVLTMMQMNNDFTRNAFTATGKLSKVGTYRGTPVWCDQYCKYSGGASTLILANGWLVFKRNGGLIEREVGNMFTIQNDIDFEIHGTKATHYLIL